MFPAEILTGEHRITLGYEEMGVVKQGFTVTQGRSFPLRRKKMAKEWWSSWGVTG